jgi:predicted ABC-type ATPase
MTPRILIFAGPNGAGKTTFAREYLPQEAGCPVFINADLIAEGISPFQPDTASMKAGRLMLEIMAEHLARKESFAFETTLSGLSYARQIPQWRADGYFVELVFLSLPSADAAVARVATRVRQGGHDIPEPVIRRRFEAGARNFRDVYRSLVDEWRAYDNSGSEPILIEGGPMSEFEAHEGSPDATPPQFADPLPALRRAAERARRVAVQTNTPLVLVRDGKVVHVSPNIDLVQA